MDTKLLQRVDKRLAILEATSKDHFERTDKSLDRIESSLNTMKIRVAGVAAIISLLIGVLSIWLKTL